MSWLRKLGKIASIAAPIVAAPFTGGASLALIGAGAGAAGAALDHKGLKGALLGAGLGAGSAFGGKALAAGLGRGASGASGAAANVGKSASGFATNGPSLAELAAGNVPSLAKHSLMSGVGNYLKGIDPTTAILGGLSLAGGQQGPQQRHSFKGTGGLTDPREALYKAQSAAYRLGQGLTERGPVQLRRPGPAPVNIPGLPFQIGGGLGTDPADVLDMTSLFKYDPFSSVARAQSEGKM